MSDSRPSPVVGCALVTGAGLRIGRAIAVYLADRGWPVAVHYRNSRDDAKAVVAEIRRTGGAAELFAADLMDEEQVQGLVPAIADRLGPIALLINNASIFERDSAATATRGSWDRHMEVNLRAPFVLTQQMAAQLPDGTEGNVINLLDQRVWKLTPAFTSYTLSKHGLWTLTRTLAQALAPRMRINAIGPGPALPNKRQSRAHFDAQIAALPLQRGTDTDEICRCVRFLLETRSMTGQMIALDGGQHLSWRTADIIGVVE